MNKNHTTTRRLGAILLGASLALTACGGANAAKTGAAKTEAAPAAAAADKAATTAALPATATCPVSGEVFKPTAETKTAVYEGKTYYMCCPGCAKKFAANPTQYVGGPAPAAAPQPADAPATTGDAAGAKKADCAGDCDDCDDAAKAK